MRKVGIKILKNSLSEYVRLAAAGETVLVTDRDRVVAELVPPRAGSGAPDADALWAEAVRQGDITPAANPRAALPLRKPIMRLGQLMADLQRDRDDR